MLSDVASGAFDAALTTAGIRVRRMEVTLPVELGVRRKGDRLELLGDLPRLVTRTDFDAHPDRVRIVWTEEEPA
jgi:hypothetical protein